MRPYVDESKCQGHAVCVEVCPADPNVFEMEGSIAKVVNPDECIECGQCEEGCPEDAIELKD